MPLARGPQLDNIPPMAWVCLVVGLLCLMVLLYTGRD